MHSWFTWLAGPLPATQPAMPPNQGGDTASRQSCCRRTGSAPPGTSQLCSQPAGGKIYANVCFLKTWGLGMSVTAWNKRWPKGTYIYPMMQEAQAGDWLLLSYFFLKHSLERSHGTLTSYYIVAGNRITDDNDSDGYNDKCITAYLFL